jgi:hypothetical protein
MNMPVFNFHNMTNMHKSYACQLQQITKNLEKKIPRTKPKLMRELNLNSMKNHKTLPNCNTSSLTQPHPTQTHLSPQSYSPSTCNSLKKSCSSIKLKLSFTKFFSIFNYCLKSKFGLQLPHRSSWQFFTIMMIRSMLSTYKQQHFKVVSTPTRIKTRSIYICEPGILRLCFAKNPTFEN